MIVYFFYHITKKIIFLKNMLLNFRKSMDLLTGWRGSGFVGFNFFKKKILFFYFIFWYWVDLKLNFIIYLFLFYMRLSRFKKKSLSVKLVLNFTIVCFCYHIIKKKVINLNGVCELVRGFNMLTWVTQNMGLAGWPNKPNLFILVFGHSIFFIFYFYPSILD
jgi:hypothetical protein